MYEQNVLLGKLLAQVEALSVQVADLTDKVEAMEARLHTGRGLLYGAIIFAGGAGAGLSTVVNKVLQSGG